MPAQTKKEYNSHNYITGKVIDSASDRPLDYATISLYMSGSKAPLTGTTTNASGLFSVKGISAGNYKVVIEFIGYVPYTIKNVTLDKRNSAVDLKTIRLQKNSALLRTVTIATDGNIIENKIDKIVFNPEDDLTSQGGVATDILKKVPQVSVDVEGTVELAGSSSIRFLIDGKPSTAFGNNIADVLQSIPASQVKSIEVVTNPGAKYDAEGLGGIINIILKKNNSQGVNGNLSLTAGTRQQNGSFNFNARKNNFGINAFVSGGVRLNATTPLTYTRVSKDSANKSTDILQQDGNSRFNRHGIETGIGFDWTYKKKNNFSGSFIYNSLGRNNNGIINQSQLTTDDITGNIIEKIAALNNTNSSFRFHDIDAGLNYKRNFNNPNRELEVAVNTSFGNDYTKASNTQFILPTDSIVNATDGKNPGRENEVEIKIDYTEPVSKNISLGTGGKITFDDISSASDILGFHPTENKYFYDSSLSNNFNYHQKVYALYAELSFPVGKLFDAKIGGRYERTNINSTFSTAVRQMSPMMFSNTPGSYNTFVPSFFVLKKLNDNETIKFNYSKRIRRPDYRDLNPFINTSDPKNISNGNLFLNPEFGSNYELSYDKDFGKKGSFLISAFYRVNKNDIQNYIVYYPELMIGDSTYTNVAVSTPENIGAEKNIGLSFFVDITIANKVSVRTNMFGFYRHTINVIDAGYNSNSFDYHLNLNAAYQFSKSFAGEFFGNFNSANHDVQGRIPSFILYSIALRKQIWNKQGSVALTTVNPFNKYINRSTSIFGPGFSVNELQRIPYRSIGINFTWKFGNLEFKKSNNEGGINLSPPVTD